MSSRLPVCVVLMSLLFLPILPSAAWADTIVLVTSDGGHPVLREIAGGISALEGTQFSVVDLEGETQELEAVVEEIKAKKPSAVVTLGPGATEAIAPLLAPIPVVFCGVANPKALLKNQSKHTTGVELNPTLTDQLKLLVTVLDPKKVGVLYSPTSKGVVDMAAQWLEKRHVELVAQVINSSGQTQEGIDALAKAKVDALWMVPDNLNLSKPVFSALTDFSLKQGVPLFGLTPTLVSMGALLTISSDYEAMGKQVSHLLKEIIRGGKVPLELAVESPRVQRIILNAATAKKMKNTQEMYERLLGYAAETGHPVYAVEGK